jgi:mannosyltransferase OCH1-like enzyme
MEIPTQYTDIPKLIHMIWLGPFPYPNEWVDTWKPFCQNFGWTLKLWREKDIEDFGLINNKEFNESVSYQQKSDIARYEILYRLGGMYIDCDMVYLGNNIEKILPLSSKMFIGVNESPSDSLKIIGAPYLCNGWFISPPKHAILKRCIDLIPERVKIDTPYAFLKTGPILLNMSIQEPIITIPTHWIFPKDFHLIHNIPDVSIFKKSALIFTYNRLEYPHLKKLKQLEETGKCKGDECSQYF